MYLLYSEIETFSIYVSTLFWNRNVFYLYIMSFVNWNFVQNMMLHIFVSSIESLEKIASSAIKALKYTQISHTVDVTAVNASSRSDLIVYDHSYKNWGEVYLCVF